MKFEELKTERLILKKLTPELFKELFQNHTEEEVIRILGLSGHDEYVKEKAKNDGGYTTYDRSIIAFLIVLPETGETIGRGGFHNWYSAHRRAEIGYHIFKDKNKRKGYMTEAVSAILTYGFESMDLNRVEAFIAPDNVASLGVVSKYGFTKEGYLRQHYNSNGEMLDTVVYGLLKDEYAGMIK